jgi:hypothetical protein
MDTQGNHANTQQANKRFWRDYVPIEKMTFVMAIFSFLYSMVTIGLFIISYGELDGLKKDQRPWISVLSQTKLPDKGNNLAVSFFFVTTGKSPAKSVQATFYVEGVKNGESPQLLATNQAGSFTTGILFPNTAPQIAPISYDLLGSQLEDFKEGRIFLTIYGHVSYTDIFHTQHWTNFCGFGAGKEGGYTAQKCTAYNDTDDN